jgi:hypothetical protein
MPKLVILLSADALIHASVFCCGNVTRFQDQGRESINLTIGLAFLFFLIVNHKMNKIKTAETSKE